MVGETVAAPYRLAQVRLSNAIHTTVGVGHDVAHAALGPARSAVTQLHAATHARHLDDSTLRVMADGSGDTNDAFVRGVYRAADDDSVSSYGQIDRAVERIDDLDGPAQTRAKRLVADTDGDGVKYIDELDDDAFDIFFEIDNNPGFDGGANFDQWRANLARGSDGLGSERVNEYVVLVDEAASNPKITNADGLVADIAGSQAAESQIRGQAGEVRSALRYADDNDVTDVTIEPGNGKHYDMRVQQEGGETQFVEVKTRATGKDVDYHYANSQLLNMNKKYANAQSDPEIDIGNSERTLEIRAGEDATDLESAKTWVEHAINDRPQIEADSVRLQASDGASETISIDS